MSPQIDLFAGQSIVPDARALARADNPATSKAAASSVGQFAPDHHAVIVDVMRRHGSNGLTVHEIAALCRLDAHSIGKRVGELEKALVLETRIVPDGDSPDGYNVQCRKTPSGRAVRVWFLGAK